MEHSGLFKILLLQVVVN